MFSVRFITYYFTYFPSIYQIRFAYIIYAFKGTGVSFRGFVYRNFLKDNHEAIM